MHTLETAIVYETANANKYLTETLSGSTVFNWKLKYTKAYDYVDSS